MGVLNTVIFLWVEHKELFILVVIEEYLKLAKDANCN